MTSRLFAGALAAAALMTMTGCAETPADPNAKPQQPSELVYRTGSNIPVRDARPPTKEEKDRQAEDAQRLLSRPTGAGATRQ